MQEEQDDTISESMEISIALGKAKLVKTMEEELSRDVERPGVSFTRMIRPSLKYLIPWVVALIVSCIIFVKLDISLWYLLIFPLILIVLICVFARRVIVDSVLVYQQYAPAKLRRACRFEPTCSQYMIMAVEKYGAGKGFAKGIRRICRCHHPNGGVDYP